MCIRDSEYIEVEAMTEYLAREAAWDIFVAECKYMPKKRTKVAKYCPDLNYGWAICAPDAVEI